MGGHYYINDGIKIFGKVLGFMCWVLGVGNFVTMCAFHGEEPPEEEEDDAEIDTGTEMAENRTSGGSSQDIMRGDKNSFNNLHNASSRMDRQDRDVERGTGRDGDQVTRGGNIDNMIGGNEHIFGKDKTASSGSKR